MAVPFTAIHLVLLVPQYTQRQERQERRTVERMGAQLEVFPHHLFSKVHQLRNQLPSQLLKDRMLLERLRNLYGDVANLPKISDDDLLCRYMGAGPGDVMISGACGAGMCFWRLVVPSRSPPPEHPGELERRVAQRRSDRDKFMGYLRTISQDPNYY